MAYYQTCPFCGANLDPNEVCECAESMYSRLSPSNKKLVDNRIIELLSIQKAALSSTSTQGSKVDGAKQANPPRYYPN